MNESVWTCERCGKKYDLEMGEGWVLLAEEIPSSEDDRVRSREPYEAVCYECADELQAIVEKCTHNCASCEAARIWGLSFRECLRFRFKFDLLDQISSEDASLLGRFYDMREMWRALNAC